MRVRWQHRLETTGTTTLPGLLGADHHQAEMRVLEDVDGRTTLVWCTDVLPHQIAEVLRDAYTAMFDELVAAVNEHADRSGAR